MPLRLNNFKTQIPETILKRGYDYYRKGHILELNYDTEGVWTAEVSGSELYEVEIEQQADGSLLWECTCIYAEEALCKHVAAVLYQIEADFLKGKTAPPVPSKTDRQALLRQTLQAMPSPTLIDILVDWAAKDRTFKNQLLLRLGARDESVEDYTAILKTAIKQARDRYGAISGRRLVRDLEPLFNQTDEKRAQQPMMAASVYIAVIEQCVAHFPEIDDETGSLYGHLEDTFDRLEQCVPHLNDEQRKQFFQLCLQNRSYLKDSDWEWAFYNLAAQMVTTSAERDALFQALDVLSSTRRQNWGFSFYDEKVAELKLSVLEQLGESQAIDEFLKYHLHIDSFREKLIRQALHKQDFARARLLAEEGLRQHRNDSYTSSKITYQRFLLDIATRQKDTAQMIPLLRDLWFSTGEEHLYETLRRTVAPAEWPRFFQGIEKDSKDHPRLAWLYKHEKLWPNLMRIVQAAPNMYLTQYQKDLEAHLPEEMSKFYERLAFQAIESTFAGREAYKTACAYLSRMQQLGDDERVAEIIERLISQYPRRRALIEELKQL